MPPFQDRRHAGRMLAQHLAEYAGRGDVCVLALPRGGVPVGFEVARALRVPLDVLVVRKLGIPGHEEAAMGAIASDGVRVLNQGLVERLGLSEAEVAVVTAREQGELERRERLYRGEQPALEVRGRTVLVVDDGLATGSTMRAALLALAVRGPAARIVAVPTGAPEACAELSTVAERVVCATMPNPFRAVGIWYGDFSQTSDAEVHALLVQSRSKLGA